jgi:hypothetical protein
MGTIAQTTETDKDQCYSRMFEFVKHFDTPWDTNIFMEFIDTLVDTDVDVTPALAKRVWRAVTRNEDMEALKMVANSFLTSQDPADLARLWEEDLRVVDERDEQAAEQALLAVEANLS